MSLFFTVVDCWIRAAEMREHFHLRCHSSSFTNVFQCNTVYNFIISQKPKLKKKIIISRLQVPFHVYTLSFCTVLQVHCQCGFSPTHCNLVLLRLKRESSMVHLIYKFVNLCISKNVVCVAHLPVHET